jgi:proteasome accessory factor B
MEKTERQLNLIALFMNTRQPLRSPDIHKAIYADSPSEEAFKRKFERDKTELAEIGFIVETVPVDVWGDQKGFALKREETLLPDVGLEPDEYAALMLAAQAWQGQPGGAGPRTALLKLSATGGDEGGAAPWILPSIDVSSPRLEALFNAVERRKQVTFTYRTGGGGAPAKRTVDPYSLTHRGAWYLSGFDHDRKETRLFKVDRIDGAVEVAAGKKPDFDAPAGPPESLRTGPWEGERGRAQIVFSPEVSWWAERRTGAKRVGSERDDGWVSLEMGYEDLDRFAAWILGFADDAVVVDPPELRTLVVNRLRAAAGG